MSATRKLMAAALAAATLCTFTVGIGGCATLKPWERGRLMQRCMQGSLDPLETAMDLHVHRTREAIMGAAAGGGASCGCN